MEETEQTGYAEETLMYETKGNLVLPNSKAEDVDIRITNFRVLIDAKKPIDIVVFRIIDIVTTAPSSDYSDYSAQTQDTSYGTTTLTYLDYQDEKQEFSLELAGVASFNYWLNKAIEKRVATMRPVDLRAKLAQPAEEEVYPDKRRTELCNALRSIGLNARIIKKGRPEEAVEEGQSCGLIEILGGPIRWVNVVEYHVEGPPLGGHENSKNIYLVPDSAISTNLHARWCRIECAIVKAVPLFGRRVGVRWEGQQDEIISRLNEDTLLNHSLLESKTGLIIKSNISCGYWAITSKDSYGDRLLSQFIPKREPPPSSTHWDCYKAIARHLLDFSAK